MLFASHRGHGDTEFFMKVRSQESTEGRLTANRDHRGCLRQKEAEVGEKEIREEVGRLVVNIRMG